MENIQADNMSQRSEQSKRRNFKEWLKNKKQTEQALDKKQLYGNILNELKNHKSQWLFNIEELI